MSTKTPAGLQDAGTTDDAPTLEPMMTAVICEHPATDRPAAYDFAVWAAIVSCSTDTAKRVLEDERQ